MTNEEERKLDYIFLLEMLNMSDGSDFQRDCILSNMEHFFTTYQDENMFSILLTLFTSKFNLDEA